MSQKQLILENLHELLAHNVIGDIQYNYRYIGFNGELSFLEWYQSTHPNDRLFDGGYFLPTQEYKECYDKSSIYFTVSKDKPEEYAFIYESIAKLSLKKYYFIQYNTEKQFEEWEQKDLLKSENPIHTPELSVFEYLPKDAQFKVVELPEFLANYQINNYYRPKNNIPEAKKTEWIGKLEKFDEEQLLQLYVQRLIFDGFLGFKVKRGIPSDIDCIALTSRGLPLIMEVKEKDLSKGPLNGFGMDLSRIEALRVLEETTGINVYYIVRRVANQTTRDFMEWRVISIKNFIEKMDRKPIAGGTGMRATDTYNPTYLCELNNFVKRD
ncbi:MAG: hypothetical protein REI64_10735 [Pedobacter sp.]|uniref:hypothetical protein n=1 Tax=Pedobacter sp. TaxID=1411316 RepID=UPI002809AB5C|nr:hypothetical protein [Pedobacter sp.]MDQ8005266.1 hypothetical protein [Pedobacter sp.]